MKSQLSGIERHEDRMGYRRTFSVPAGRPIGAGQAAPAHPRLVDVDRGLLTRSRRVLEPDPARLRVAHQALIRDASRNDPTGYPGN